MLTNEDIDRIGLLLDARLQAVTGPAAVHLLRQAVDSENRTERYRKALLRIAAGEVGEASIAREALDQG